jgi:hypothetical protein
MCEIILFKEDEIHVRQLILCCNVCVKLYLGAAKGTGYFTS